MEVGCEAVFHLFTAKAQNISTFLTKLPFTAIQKLFKREAQEEATLCNDISKLDNDTQ